MQESDNVTRFQRAPRCHNATVISDSSPALPTRLLRTPFVLFLSSRVCSGPANQIAGVAFGWFVYDRTRNAYALGYLGLCQFLPVFLLTLPAGHVADRFNRKRIVLVCNSIVALLFAAVAVAGSLHALSVATVFVAATLLGAVAAFQRPTMSALINGVVPQSVVRQAIAASSSGMQTATIFGPSIGGLLYAGGIRLPFGVAAALVAVSCACLVLVSVAPSEQTREPATLRSVLSGIAFVRSSQTLLGAISLDLFAVLLGGVTALLPIFARSILHAGPVALGMLRSAPAVGALIVSVPLSHRSIGGKVGLKMFGAVIVFGIATVAFALSRNMALSVASLAVLGGADNISVVIRSSMVQLSTPDAMRGRVGAVNSLFIGTSNQLGEFESGITAGWFGPVAASVLGGMGTILVALLWMRLFPKLRDLGDLPGARAA